ncbi:heme-thiolate peroxidase [Pleurotus djamor]|nr:heme-thiolate peroxidase [Pleurotus djamor]
MSDAASSSSAYSLPAAIPTYYPPLPSDHPPIPAHAHKAGKCPFSAKYEYCPPQEGDIRSPCPALNTMANHGYINRDGKNLTANGLVRGLMACYNLTLPLAIVLSYGGFVLIHKYNLFQTITLHDVAKHGYVEHDASLVHRDVKEGVDEKVEVMKKRFWGLLGEKKAERFYASIDINEGWVEELVRDARIDQEDHKADLYPFGRSPSSTLETRAQTAPAVVSPVPSSSPIRTAPPPLSIQPPTPHIDGLPTTLTSVIQTSPSGGQEVSYVPQHSRGTSAGTATPSTAADSLFSTSGQSTSTAATSPSSSPVSSKFKGARRTIVGSNEATTSARSSPSPDIPDIPEHGEYTEELVESPTTASRRNTFPTSHTSTSINLTPSQSFYATNYMTPKSMNRILLSPRALARSRVRREYESWEDSGKTKKIDDLHAEIARGEMAIVLGMWGVELPEVEKDSENFPGEGDVLGGDKKSSTKRKQETRKGVPIEWLREWIAHERLPGGWRKMKKQGLLSTIKINKEIKKGMEALRGQGVGVLPADIPSSTSGNTLGASPSARLGEVPEKEKVAVEQPSADVEDEKEKEVEMISYRGWRTGGEF